MRNSLLLQTVCEEIAAAREAGVPVHRARFARWGHALGLGIEQTIVVTGLEQVDYGPRVSEEQWKALEDAKKVLGKSQVALGRIDSILNGSERSD